MTDRPKLAVIAVGGNALISDEDHLSIADQYAQAAITARHIADMIEAGWNVVVTHGNGPQMGFILRRSELSIHEVAPVPMDYAGADLQGAIGYMFVKAFRNEFRRRGIRRQPVAVVTETLVDLNDPAFKDPTKPIGSHMEKARAKELAAQQGWTVKEDAGRGWRRVVPSPIPKKIVDLDVIGTLVRRRLCRHRVRRRRHPRCRGWRRQSARRRGGGRQGPRFEPARADASAPTCF